jgi:predicted Zn-ribbon and HTH transcriptional regulator
MDDRKIPPKEIVADTIKKVLSSRKIVESQEELALLVEKELKKVNKDYVVRPTRVKRIALEIQEIEVKAKTRKSISLQKIDKCPICDSEVKEMKVKNLLGKEIVVGYKCSKCGYESDLEAFLPMKYIFVWKG